MIYEVLATIRVARDQDGIYMATIDLGDGSAPESIEGHTTIESLCLRAARMVAASMDPPEEAS